MTGGRHAKGTGGWKGTSFSAASAATGLLHTSRGLCSLLSTLPNHGGWHPILRLAKLRSGGERNASEFLVPAQFAQGTLTPYFAQYQPYGVIMTVPIRC